MMCFIMNSVLLRTLVDSFVIYTLRSDVMVFRVLPQVIV
jgi:hypothetical protein